MHLQDKEIVEAVKGLTKKEIRNVIGYLYKKELYRGIKEKKLESMKIKKDVLRIIQKMRVE